MLVFSWTVMALSITCYEVNVGWDDTSLYLCFLTCGLLDELVVIIDCQVTFFQVFVAPWALFACYLIIIFKVLLFVSFVLAFQSLWFHWSQAPKLLGYWSLEACGVRRGLSSVLQAWSLYHQISSLRVCPHCWSFCLC
jgi:hypothetical protein